MKQRIALALAACAVFVGLVTWRADAMPPFAQAYGVKCSLCHVMVPALNAYGRYVQRTGYASIPPEALKGVFPLWFGENTSYSTTDATYPHQLKFGNVALHAIGEIGNDWSYHAQQWIVQGEQQGNLDTGWLAYNNLAHRNGHLFIGKIEAAGPSPFSQWTDISTFATPEITVGEHVYQNDANRWGARFAYIRGNIDAEVGWLGSGGGWSGISDFSNDTDKSLSYKFAIADPTKPTEYGIYGSRGSFPLAEGGYDQYRSTAAYVERDPVGNMPGFFGIYQIGYDGNPGAGAPSSTSHAATLEVYQTFFHHNLMLGLRRELTNDGMGNIIGTGQVEMAVQFAKYLHGYAEGSMGQFSTPTWNYMLWWTVPLNRNPRPPDT